MRWRPRELGGDVWSAGGGAGPRRCPEWLQALPASILQRGLVIDFTGRGDPKSFLRLGFVSRLQLPIYQMRMDGTLRGH